MPATATLDAPTTDELRHTFALAEQHFGQVPNLVRVLATNPTLCSSITAFYAQALRDGRVSWAFKELVIVKTLRSIGAYYSYGAHERLALELGNSPERIGDLAGPLWQAGEHFDDGERAVLELVVQVGQDANAVPDELWTRLRAHWDHGQLLELCAVITTFIMIGRLGDTLGVSDPVLFASPVR
ncbi:MAG TPA: carboxymuconolactone decarboxylase family protein [Acidimicrobiales bacterium]|nr:carboxymuconolactone decarboxylase family protein [Acidimicrobiales bacterium]